MKSKKILSVFLSVLMMVLTISPITAFARSSVGSTSNNISIGEDYEQKIKTEYSEVKESNTKTKVALTIEDSDLIVSVPTTIIVSGTPNKSGEYIGNYSVGVRGDMSGNKEVTIAPEESNIELLQKGKSNRNATITQEKTLFNSDDFKNNVTTNGVVTAAGLTAGSWNGVTNFNIGVNILPVEPLKGYTTLYEYDLSATENDNVKAYYAVPNKNTTVVKKSQRKAPKARANSADSNTIEYNGVVYTLSDEDTLVISGNGKMKENIQAELIDYKGIQDAVATEFNVRILPYMDYFDSVGNGTTVTTVYWTENHIYPFAVKTPSYDNDKEKMVEIHNYIDTIFSNYAISLPKSVIVKDGVTNISKKAFYNCKSLEQVNIVANSVTTIEDQAFYNCSALTNVTILDNVTSIGSNAFKWCENLTSINIPNSVKSIGSNAFDGCKSLTSINIPNNVTSIGSSAFNDCSSLTNAIIIPNSITSIESSVFSGCENLTSITIPDSVTSIGSNAFNNCRGLTNITIPDSVTSIGRQAFGDCRGLTNVTIPNSVTSIGDYIFSYCINLTSVTIGNNVTSIGSYAFKTCTSLTNITIPGSVTSIRGYTFDGCNSLKSVKIGNGVTTIEDNAFSGESCITSINIPDSVTSIGERAFYNCKGLTNVTIPNSVTNISTEAFMNCSNLSTVTMSSGITKVGRWLFTGIAKGATIYCENQEIADLLSSASAVSSTTTVVVAPEMFE